MSEFAPRLLFVPVSGAIGTGEYVRALTLASAAQARWPKARIQFVLSREAPYAGSCPFEHRLLPASATLCTPQVIEVLREFVPQAVIFDNAGRQAQFAAAVQLGARVIYISARRRQRRKAFRLRLMRLIDEHWIAYPAFVAGELSFLERGKLALFPHLSVRFLGVLLPQASAQESTGESEPYVLVVPGGGTNARALAAFSAAASALAETTRVLLVAPLIQHTAPLKNSVTYLEPMPLPRLLTLIRGARLVLVNGGATLLQAIACAVPAVAAPASHDQPQRIRRCESSGLVRAVALEPATMARACIDLLGDDAARHALSARAQAASLQDGTASALDALASVLQRARPSAGS